MSDAISQPGHRSVLGATEWALAMRRGIHCVLSSQELLNKINVFPVADGDTGTNLALTLASAEKALTKGADNISELLEQTADALLDGARGNSGAIMAQFFQGLADGSQAITHYTRDSLCEAVSTASSYARDAIAEPREGTILTVIQEFASALRASQAQDFAALFKDALGQCRAALARTPEQLAVLKKAGVVDAGAQGFCEWLAGVSAYLIDGQAPPENPDSVAVVESQVDVAGNEEDLEFRYCTECIVTGSEIDRRKLRETLSELGGSLVLAGSHRKAKIHIHVNEPDRVFKAAAKFGTVSREKADDMHRQQSATHGERARVAVITDTAADIPDDVIEQLDIHSVPLRVHFGSQGFMDKVTISSTEFFRELRDNPIHPKTSQPAPGDFRRQYQYLASHFEAVIAPTLTSTVSGTLSAATGAALRTKGNKVSVIDTRNASAGQGLLTILAAEMAQNGHSAEQISAALSLAIPETRTFALLKTLEAGVRGGRVPAYARWIAEVLHLNPVLGTTADGRIKPVSALPGRKNRVEKFARFIVRKARPDTQHRINIAHAQCESEAVQLGAHLSRAIGAPGEFYCSELGAAIGVHGGAGTLVAAIMPIEA